MEIDLSSYRLVRFLQFAIASVAFVGLVTRNVGVLINGSFALGVTFLPGVLKRDYRLSLSPTLTLWITVAVFLHAIGMLGLYDEVWWWDHLTHLLSATLVAGVGYATARAFDEHSDAVYFPPRFMFVYVLLFTLAAGVIWEVLEFTARASAGLIGVKPVLIQYGLSDTIVDLIFDAAGAVLVALFGTTLLAETVETLLARLSREKD
ncbi:MULTISPECIES: hypothetical protein [unclassified Haladaptatus]|uniref:hypothetical protein n=1 Tax=unclassified Haladaptatus TaxID=2622732 RepID=UPI00209BF1E3|nr:MULTISPECIES: hypothetical protein [unclassified Haladaptatus]MCO8244669.1 hypothetical protein [Haladaptatus sp. AB643]MCO8253709.1 hypothetical protein [Haladaptatus sp. AB618]